MVGTNLTTNVTDSNGTVSSNTVTLPTTPNTGIGLAIVGDQLTASVTDSSGTLTSPAVTIPQCCNTSTALTLAGQNLTSAVTDNDGTVTSNTVTLPTEGFNTALSLTLTNDQLSASVTDDNGVVNATAITIPQGSITPNAAGMGGGVGTSTIVMANGDTKDDAVCGVRSTISTTNNGDGTTTYDLTQNDSSTASITVGGNATDMVLSAITCDDDGQQTFTIANGTPVNFNLASCIVADGTTITGAGTTNSPFVSVNPALVLTTDGNATGVTLSGTNNHTANIVLLGTSDAANNILGLDASGGLELTCTDVLGCVNVDGTTITGTGTAADPFVADNTDLALTTDGNATGVTLSGTDNHTVNIVLLGTSDAANNILGLDASGGLELTCTDVLDCVNVDGTTITGTGTAADPFIANNTDLVLTTDGNATGVTLSGTDNHTANIVLLGTSDPDNLLSLDASGGLQLRCEDMSSCFSGTESVVAGAAPTDTTDPGTAPSADSLFHCNKVEYDDCVRTWTYVNGAQVKFDEVLTGGTCVAAIEDVTPAASPTLAAGVIDVNYRLTLTSDLTATAFEAWVAGITKPAKVRDGSVIHVWPVGGTVAVNHPVLAGVEQKYSEGEAVCFKCCEGNFVAALS